MGRGRCSDLSHALLAESSRWYLLFDLNHNIVGKCQELDQDLVLFHSAKL